MDLQITANEDKIKIYDGLRREYWLGYKKSMDKVWRTEKRISWSTISNPKNDQEYSIKKIEEVLNDVLYNNSAYRSLPQPNGGRL
jgi:hypothetical protein